MAIPPEIQQITDAFFTEHAKKYDMAHGDECGRYIEAMVPHVQAHGYPDVGYLKKTGSGTQYNGHSIDGFLYRKPDEATGLLQHVDVIGNAEMPHPWKSEGGVNDGPKAAFGIDIPRYKDSDWMSSVHTVVEDTIPWAPYWGDPTSDKITRTFMYDYFRAGRSMNPGFGRWLNRALHSAFIGPVSPSEGGKPLGVDGALARHRPELCQALGGLDPNVPVPPNFFPDWG